MLDWFLWALIAPVAFGIQSFLYRSVREKGCDKFIVTLVFMAVVLVLTLIMGLLTGVSFSPWAFTLGMGVLFGTSFLLKTLAQLKALDYLPTSTVFPIGSSVVALTVLAGVVLFGESLTLLSVMGILLLVFAIIAIQWNPVKGSSAVNHRRGLLFAFLVLLPSLVMEVVNKYAAMRADIGAFIIAAYASAIVASYVGHRSVRRKRHAASVKEAVHLGISIGVANFIGYVALLTALKSGPLSIVSPIQSLHVVTAVLLSRLVHKEELSVWKFVFVLVAVAGVVLLRM